MKDISCPYDDIIYAPGFSLGLLCADDAVKAVHFLASTAKKTPPHSRRPPLVLEAARQLRAWLDDARFVFDLPLETSGTPFQQRVWKEIRKISLGKRKTYGEIADILQSAPRPVGSACGANPLPLIIPCHRVVSKDGGLGGFGHMREGFLLEIKRWLLDRETGFA